MSRESNDHYTNGRLIDGFDYVNQAWVRYGCYLTCGHPETMTCDCYGRKHEGEPTPTGRLDGSDEPAPTEPGTHSHHPDATATESDLEPAVEACRTLLTTFDKIERQKEQAREVIKEVGPDTALGIGARIALHDLTEKEKAFDWDEVHKARNAVDKEQAQIMVNQLIGPPAEEVEVLTGPTFSEYYTTRREQLRTDLDHMVRIISTPGSDTPENLRHRLTLTARLAELETARLSIGPDGYPEQGPAVIGDLQRPHSPSPERDPEESEARHLYKGD